MKFIATIFYILVTFIILNAAELTQQNMPPNQILTPSNTVTLVVIGQGIAPNNAQSAYHATALAKRAAIADAYRLLGEKIYGVRVEGVDVVKNLVLERSNVRTCVVSIIQYADIVQTKCHENFCEVEMELKLKGPDWYHKLAQKN